MNFLRGGMLTNFVREGLMDFSLGDNRLKFFIVHHKNMESEAPRSKLRVVKRNYDVANPCSH